MTLADTLITTGILAGAAFYLWKRYAKTITASKQSCCGKGCGCPVPKKFLARQPKK